MTIDNKTETASEHQTKNKNLQNKGNLCRKIDKPPLSIILKLGNNSFPILLCINNKLDTEVVLELIRDNLPTSYK